MAHDHDHADHDDHKLHNDHSELSEVERRVRALETVLTQKGYVDPAALDVLIDTYQTKIGPRNGAIAELGYMGRQGEHMIALQNTPGRHNIVVCTLCSCYPWTVLGLPPVWYKSAPYRSRVVKDPRGVLRDFGVTLPAETEIRVWDSTAEVRYLVIPERPAGTDDLDEAALCALVTRDSMIGTGLARPPAEAT
jgi:nitrile hydratase